MNYTATNDNIHIFNSCKERKKDIPSWIGIIWAANIDKEVCKKRSQWGARLEWYAHNFLYDLGIAIDHTAEVDIQIPRKWWEPIAYAIVGAIGWIFIR